MFIAKEYQDRSLLIYQGVFTVNLISILGNHIRLLPDHDTLILQRIFKVFIELSQNVSYYSYETIEIKQGVNCGIGWVTVQDYDDFYRITTCNSIAPEHGPKLEAYCKEINSMEAEALKVLKRKTRAQAMLRDTNAQIGLIQTGLISGSKLDSEISAEHEKSHHFRISATINKDSESINQGI
jgi:hypothetical protein